MLNLIIAPKTHLLFIYMVYFTALAIDPDTGEKFFADTHAIFFTRGICQPLMEDYANTTVTLAVNRDTGMVVIIG